MKSEIHNNRPYSILGVHPRDQLPCFGVYPRVCSSVFLPGVGGNTHHSKCWSLPPMLTHLTFCRGLHAIRSLQYAPRYPLYALSSILYPASCLLYSFLTNKPNVKIDKISLSIVMIKYYENSRLIYGSIRARNKPNSNPFSEMMILL
jgi:hypothetical protein